MSIPAITHIVSLLEKGQTGEARLLLDTLIQRVPNQVSARVLKARMMESEADFKGALRQWKKAAYLCPDNPVVENGLRKAVLRDLFSEQIDFNVAGVALSAKSALDGSSWSPVQSPMSGSNARKVTPVWGPAVPPASPVRMPSAAPRVIHPEFQDLDKLIIELESARIVPDPDVKMIPQGELETEIDDVVSETLAKIYANQKFYDEAAAVYEKLAVQRPGNAEDFLQKAAEMRQKACGKG